MLTGRRLFVADNETQLIALVQRGEIAAPSEFRAEVPAALDRICARALCKHPDARYPSAVAMAKDLDRDVDVASSMRVGDWMKDVVGPLLDARSKLVAEVESGVHEVSRDALEELARISASATFEEAATRARATVQSMAKAADQAVRDRARKMASQAARNVGALATALKVQPSNPVLAALAPLVGKTKKDEKKGEDERKSDEKTPPPGEDATRSERPKSK
jgi:serine/threonine-protein kinase